MHSCRHFPELPGYIKGEKFNVEGQGVCQSQCWHSSGGGTDHTGEAEKI